MLAVWLTEPPKNNGDTIGAILFDVHEALRKGNKLKDELIQEIVKSHPFPEYRTVAEYLPVAPKDWLGLPAEMTIGCELSEGACLYREFWDEYHRDSLKDVIATVFSPRVDGLLLNYSLRVRELIPLMPYAVDWPLARRGKDLPYKRKVIQGKALEKRNEYGFIVAVSKCSVGQFLVTKLLCQTNGQTLCAGF